MVINIYELPAAMRKELAKALTVVKLDLEITSQLSPAFDTKGRKVQ